MEEVPDDRALTPPVGRNPEGFWTLVQSLAIELVM